jgi:tRNA(Leu) C34 or U34 (ribose-2'-O)-methylase TrmL
VFGQETRASRGDLARLARAPVPPADAVGQIRSLNLANTVAAAAYQALRGRF